MSLWDPIRRALVATHNHHWRGLAVYVTADDVVLRPRATVSAALRVLELDDLADDVDEAIVDSRGELMIVDVTQTPPTMTVLPRDEVLRVVYRATDCGRGQAPAAEVTETDYPRGGRGWRTT